MSQFPPIYDQLLTSRLVSEGQLQEAALEFSKEVREFSVKDSGSLSGDTPSSDLDGWDAADFTLAENIQIVNSDLSGADSKETSISVDELNSRFLAKLTVDGFLNAWQVSQIKRGRTRFSLGPYRIVDAIGSGGYGYVFLGRTAADPSNMSAEESEKKRPHDYAIKTIPHTLANERHVKRFLREIEINRILVHPNIVRLVNSGEEGKVHYAVYEYMDGKSAYQLVRRNEKLNARIASYIIHETAKGLFYLHQKGFVHRDLKPGNILLSRKGEVKLADFGLVTGLSAGRFRPQLGDYADSPDELNGNGKSVAGTSDYIPPDQIMFPNAPNILWDIYSLGCTFYYLVTGLVPFPSGTTHQKLSAHLRSDAPDPKMFNPGLPWDIARLIMEMMDKDPQKRPADAEEVCRRLKSYIGSDTDLKRLVCEKKKEVFSGLPVKPKWRNSMNDDDFLETIEESLDDSEPDESRSESPPESDSVMPENENSVYQMEQDVLSLSSEEDPLSEEISGVLGADCDMPESNTAGIAETDDPGLIELENSIKRLKMVTAVITTAVCVILAGVILCFFLCLC